MDSLNSVVTSKTTEVTSANQEQVVHITTAVVSVESGQTQAIVNCDQTDLRAEVERLRIENHELRACSARVVELEAKIEQLSQENRSLTIQISKTVEIEQTLAKTFAVKESLDVEIRKLRADIAMYEAGEIVSSIVDLKMKMMITEREKLNAVIADKENQIAQLEIKLAQAGKSEVSSVVVVSETIVQEKEKLIAQKVEEIQRINTLLVEKTKEVEVLKARVSEIEILTAKISELTVEKQKLNELLVLKTQEVEKKSSVTVLQEDKYVLIEKEKETLRTINSQQEKKILELIQERDTLKQTLNQRNTGQESPRVRFQVEKETVLTDMKSSSLSVLVSENQKLLALLAEKAKEIESLNIKIVQLSQSGFSSQVIVQERERMQPIRTEKSKEVEIIRTKTIEADSALVTGLRGQIASLVSENGKLQANILEKSRQIQEYEAKIKSYCSLEVMLKSVSEEKDRLNVLLKQKLQEIEVLKTKSVRIETDQVSIVDIKAKVTHVTKECERLNSLVVEKDKQLAELQSKISTMSEIENKLRGALLERQKLMEENLRIRASTSLQIDEKVLHVEKERTLLEHSISEKEKLIAELTVQIAAHHHHEKEVKDLRERLLMVIDENKRLNEMICHKDKEIKSFLARHEHNHNLEVQITTVIQERDALHAVISEKITEIDSLKIRIAHLEGEVYVIHELKDNLKIVSHENERLNELIIEKNEVIYEWETKYNLLERLYLNIKEATEELQVVKRRYQDAVRVTEKEEPHLRNSHHAHTHAVTYENLGPDHYSQSHVIGYENEYEGHAGTGNMYHSSIVKDNLHSHGTMGNVRMSESMTLTSPKSVKSTKSEKSIKTTKTMGTTAAGTVNVMNSSRSRLSKNKY